MNDKVHLLLIDDEKNYLLVLETLLTEAGYAVTALNDPETALAFLEESEVDIVITDMKMPRISGREVLERVKKNWPHIPVLIMTAFGSIESAVEAMRYGAFNYITKPFSPKELVARIKAVMRRISPMAVEEVIEMQGLSLDPSSHRVMTGENPLDMGPTEFKLLHFFMTHPERVYSREQLLNHVWGTNVYVEDRTVDVHIRRLRKALEHSGHDRMVQTVRGTGYRFSARF